jgi:hypothetical protein
MDNVKKNVYFRFLFLPPVHKTMELGHQDSWNEMHLIIDANVSPHLVVGLRSSCLYRRLFYCATDNRNLIT